MNNTPIADKIMKWIYEGDNPETGKEKFERLTKEKKIAGVDFTKSLEKLSKLSLEL